MKRSTEIAESIVRLNRFASGDGRVGDLTAAQWCALRYFARANRRSCTVTAFADYHLTTRGSASQTVKSLVDKLLLKRTRSQVDRRIVYLDLTEQGREASKEDPLNALIESISSLPDSQAADLIAALPTLLARLAGEAADTPFRHL